MVNNLIANKEVNVINSKEVAIMMGKQHGALLREIDGSKDGKTVGLLPALKKANFNIDEYFISNTYIVKNRAYKCYEITKKGCELLGNKQQGEKGIVFTAKYIEAFNRMESVLKTQSKPQENIMALPSNYKEALLALVRAEEEKEALLAEVEYNETLLEQVKPKADIFDMFISSKDTYSVNTVSKVFAIKGLGRNSLYKYLRDKKVVFGKSRDVYQRFIERGLFKSVEEIYVGPHGEKRTMVVRFLPKGIEWLYGELKKDNYIMERSMEQLITVINEENNKKYI